MTPPRPSAGAPVRAADRVSDVLARDEGLVEVFVRHAPHFAKLRNRAMRRVMARLVTVEQAARTAGVPADALVRDLNAALGLAPSPDDARARASEAAEVGSAAGGDPSARRPEGWPVVELDVREDLRAGREPFSRIMSAVGAHRAGEVLRLRAIFEPAPLYDVLARRGFAHETASHAPDDWSVWFWRPPEGSAASPAVATDDDSAPHAADEHWLDVRGLEPPEPMMRTLAALEALPPGHTLVQVNVRVPQFLLPILAERGCTVEVDERADRVLVRIRRDA